jgi:4-amino-4-deoxy-L-arabinose transferase-like glycosyltransferase
MLPSLTGAPPSIARNTSDLATRHPLDNPLLLGLLFLAWLLATIWIRPLALPDEGRYAGVAWEMVRSGQWLTPTLDGLPYFHKPPLFYWLTAISIEVFGPTEWSVRLASTLGAVVAAASGYGLFSRWLSLQSARWYLLVLATMPLFYGGSQYANHDMLVAGFIAGAIALAADALLSADAGFAWRRTMLLAWACMALGLLSKGLIGIVLPAGVIFWWMALQWRWGWLSRLLWWPGLLVFLVIASPWFILMQLKFPEFFDYFFIHQHFERFSQKGFNNQQPFWFFPAILLLLSLPWSPLLLGRFRIAPALGVRRALRLLLWTWIAVITVFFSLPNSKLVGYILPVTPAVAMLIAEVVGDWALLRRWFVGVIAAITTIAAILAVGVLAAITHYDTYSSRPLAEALRARMAPGEPLVSLRVYRFDLPLYARWPEPIPVLHSWNDPALRQQDSWPRELADAGDFDRATGERVLIDVSRLREVLCAQPVTWVVAHAKDKEPLLEGAQRVAANPHYALMRVERSGLDCGLAR